MNISKIIEDSGIVYDRYPDQPIVLPYKLDDLLIQPNDTVASDVINLKLTHLYENFLYLYSKTKIASNLIPVSSTAILGVSTFSSNLTLNFNLSTSQFIPATGIYYSSFNNTKVVHSIKNQEANDYTIISSDGISVIFFTFNDADTTSTEVPFLFSAFDPLKFNNVIFKDIVAITDGPEQSFLILDKGSNSLYKYSSKGISDSDNIFSQTFNVQGIVGGYGISTDKLSFNNPTDVITYEKNVYVLDTGNKCIKKYDENLNWEQTYFLNKDFLRYEPLRFDVDYQGNFYCLLSGNKMYAYNNDFQTKQLIDIDYLNTTEKAIDIVMSKSDNSIYYLVTNENIYKGFLNNLGNTVGKYLLYRFKYNDTQNISAFCSHENYGNDKNILISNNPNSNATMAGIFIDNKNLYDNLAVSDFDVYTLDEILIKPEEYVQSWVVNKSIAKLYANHLRLMEQLTGKFQFKYDSRGNSIFQFTRYLTTEEKLALLGQQESIL